MKCPRCGSTLACGSEKPETVPCPTCGARLRLVARRAAAGTGYCIEQVTPTGGTEIGSILPRGFMLGGFEIEQALGKGGMAMVYRGIQTSLNRPVAIKVLLPRYAKDPVLVRRFEREAGALAGLSHPNIVNIIERGESDGHYYIVLELVEGSTLNHLLHTVELRERHFVHVITEVGKALEYIHSLGLVHRDVKPSNILVTRQGVVKLSDFGIVLSGEEPETSARGATVGTASYMAPEQRRDPTTVDPRADIYALAVTFYKMFTCQLPGDPFEPPSQLNPRLPAGIDAAITRAMQANPDDRYWTVREFCDDLLRAFAASRHDAAEPHSAALMADASPHTLKDPDTSDSETTPVVAPGPDTQKEKSHTESLQAGYSGATQLPDRQTLRQWLLAFLAVGITLALVTLVLLTLL